MGMRIDLAYLQKLGSGYYEKKLSEIVDEASGLLKKLEEINEKTILSTIYKLCIEIDEILEGIQTEEVQEKPEKEKLEKQVVQAKASRYRIASRRLYKDTATRVFNRSYAHRKRPFTISQLYKSIETELEKEGCESASNERKERKGKMRVYNFFHNPETLGLERVASGKYRVKREEVEKEKMKEPVYEALRNYNRGHTDIKEVAPSTIALDQGLNIEQWTHLIARHAGNKKIRQELGCYYDKRRGMVVYK